MNDQIQAMEVTIEELKEAIDLKKLVLSLESNRAFKKIVIDGYFEVEAARLARISSEPMLNQEQRQSIFTDMAGVGAFKRFLHLIVQKGNAAEGMLSSYEADLAEARLEEAMESEA